MLSDYCFHCCSSASTAPRLPAFVGARAADLSVWETAGKVLVPSRAASAPPVTSDLSGYIYGCDTMESAKSRSFELAPIPFDICRGCDFSSAV